MKSSRASGGFLFTAGMSSMLLLAMAVFASRLAAQEANPNEWGKDFEKLTVGAREDIQYSIYRKVGEAGRIYLEFQNRKDRDVKVTFKIVNKGLDRGVPLALTGFIKAKGFWPNERAIACTHPEPVIEIQEVVTGEVEEEQAVEIDAQGKQAFTYKYRFRSDADLARARSRN